MTKIMVDITKFQIDGMKILIIIMIILIVLALLGKGK